MVIVYDMRSGEMIEQSPPHIRETVRPEHTRREPPRVIPELQLVSYTAEPPRPAPAILMGCYFDENGD